MAAKQLLFMKSCCRKQIFSQQPPSAEKARADVWESAPFSPKNMHEANSEQRAGSNKSQFSGHHNATRTITFRVSQYLHSPRIRGPAKQFITSDLRPVESDQRPVPSKSFRAKANCQCPSTCF